ncbi:peptide chain release factor N(5)-glutamine methyltransferase [Paucibacter sp. DJ2R-2]|uniref:peptide chain release factor N(5)-glutamine methyltransferase n=1 Tax=Paucibacter sp. DJ2R-2 TaxID=2893558 RepID=UPI0021E3FE80|nr:peptide chain release factor N(5)-glutamine methyltransferase [Paucibacter sp. DJ2R-2]MCV2420259.1 peptide chain release factor N(5)-glutamine methyltransferase [Paucibacter sp. DJ4R-1]MCV2436796.1 peptide chain release factor N(5)-glutamine methyltransferase [Paucibacter sp. DJ2R-2]
MSLNPPLDVKAALALARQLGLERGDAQTLLAERLQQSRAWLISHDDEALSPALAAQLASEMQQMAEGLPLAYVLGEKEFHGLRLRLSRDTLIPRADTETLVDWALELLPGLGVAPRVVDLGTGSGAIALAIKADHPAAELSAVDLSAGALEVARGNAERLGLAVEFLQGSWWNPLRGRSFELIVSNPPYIAGQDPHLPALRHEPLSALTPGGDGLSDLMALIEGAPAHLSASGWLLLEHGYDQAEPVALALQDRGFVDVGLRHDLGGQPRVSGARWPG